jgi:hypothetical protein
MRATMPNATKTVKYALSSRPFAYGLESDLNQMLDQLPMKRFVPITPRDSAARSVNPVLNSVQVTPLSGDL